MPGGEIFASQYFGEYSAPVSGLGLGFVVTVLFVAWLVAGATAEAGISAGAMAEMMALAGTSENASGRSSGVMDEAMANAGISGELWFP